MTKASAALRDVSDEDLVQQLGEAREELFNLRFQNATGQLDNSARIGQIRRQVARVNTVLRQREIAAAEEGLAAQSGNENANG